MPGEWPKFYSTIRCDVRKIETLKRNNEVMDHESIKVVKTNAHRLRSLIINADGIDRMSDC